MASTAKIACRAPAREAGKAVSRDAAHRGMGQKAAKIAAGPLRGLAAFEKPFLAGQSQVEIDHDPHELVE
jgi:hypothetical protein